ncbi:MULTISPECIES: hydrolase [Prochlorococcus]|uniref:Isochorismatase n=1 Tax=Prochlorococcus marinus str. MIT 9116 TaxID=167544 RepID=A0A0A1ZUU7_PROMR|nr:hydrolase [Prochlorococcus marinus]KGF90893.1 Isochorismatase [Prochlorococcus marinus str. MIT 9107]KGF92029.1 Isochorismatase [Prochlorococcus marinus str. MIT 9116]KGF93409.1 Isochorismatase [Prochlorococcus marinus str. MIT 9123]
MKNSTNQILPKVNALVIIDIQEKIIKPIFNKGSIIKNVKKLINAYQILEENIIVSEQNPLKLGTTIPELLPKARFKKIEKMEFSLANRKEFLTELENKQITNLLVCGIETHICIQQTVIDCLQKGFEVIIISDAMSSRNRVDHDIALKRMIQRGAILTTTESIIFELCKTADREEFKEIKNIIIS